MQDVDAQRCAGQGIDPPHAAEVQPLEQVEQRQRGLQVGQCAQRRAIVGHVLERLAVGQAAGLEHSAQNRVEKRQPQPESERRRAVLQKVRQPVVRPAAQVGDEQVLIQKHPCGVADRAVLAEQRRVDDKRHSQHSQQTAVRRAGQPAQQAVEQRHTEQEQQIVRDEPQLPRGRRERRPAQCAPRDIQPGELAQQRHRHGIEPQRQPQRERAAGLIRLLTQEPAADQHKDAARNARPAADQAEREGRRQGGVVRNAALPGQMVADDEQHAQNAQQLQIAAACRFAGHRSPP